MLWLFFINITGSVGIAGYWSEIIFIISLTENIVFVRFFETPFGSNIIASFTEFQCQGTNAFGFIWGQTFEIYIREDFLHK